MARWQVAVLVPLAGCHLIFPLVGSGEDAVDAGVGDGAVDAEPDAETDADGGGCTEGCDDLDGDGFCSAENCGGNDCDDEDPDVNPGNEVGGWSLETVGPGSGDPSLAILDDRVWVAYSLGSTVLAAFRRGPDDWVGEVVVEWLARSLSIAVGGDGIAHVAFYRPEDGSLWYAKRIGDGWWSVEPVNTDDFDAGKNCSLALDASGSPRIAYFASDGASWTALLHSTRDDDNGVWIRDEVSPVNGDAVPSVAVGSDGKSRIFYSEGDNDLFLMTQEATWVSMVFERATRRSAPLVLDGDDVPHVAFSGTGQVVYSTGNSFSPEQIALGEGQVSLALGSDDRPHAAIVRDDGTFLLLYTMRREGEWQDPETVAKPPDGAIGQPTIRVSDALIHIAFLAAGGETIVHAVRSIDDDCDGAAR